MGNSEDAICCLKNLIGVMCCDRDIAKAEKRFLFDAAKQMGLEIADWNELVRQVVDDSAKVYPMQDREKAIAVLKSMVVMARADGTVDKLEKEHLKLFAKSIGVTSSEWAQILNEIDPDTLFEPFRGPSGSITAVEDHFEKLDQFLETARASAVRVEVIGYEPFVQESKSAGDVLCFHAAPNKETTVERCRKLLEIHPEKVVPILDKFQGYQVKYLLEMGVKRCVIEPVYGQDLELMFTGQ